MRLRRHLAAWPSARERGPQGTSKLHPARNTALLVLPSVAVLIGIALPLLVHLRGGNPRVGPYSNPFLTDGGPPDWHSMWTADLTRLADIQDVGFQNLVSIVVAFTMVLVLVALTSAVLVLVSRSMERSGGIATRVVLGASRRRLVVASLREVAIILLPGVVVGSILAVATSFVLEWSWPHSPAPWSPSPVAIVPTMGLAVVGLAAAATLCWLWPLGIAWRRDLRPFFQTGERATAGPGARLVRDALVVAQVAVCITLLTTTGVLLRGFLIVSDGSPAVGADVDEMLVVDIQLPGDVRDPADRSALLRQIGASAGLVPGVVDTSIASVGALAGIGHRDVVHGLTDFPELPGNMRRSYQHLVGPGHFGFIGSPPVNGREFTPADGSDAERVVMVNELFASHVLFGNAVGKRLQLGRLAMRGEFYTVIGVVADSRGEAIGVGGEPEPAIYLSALQHPPSRVQLSVRTDQDPLALATTLEGAIRAVEPRLVLGEWRTLAGYLAELRAPLRWFAIWLGTVAAVAVLLATMGVYGIVSHSVARRTREIGIRMAVGARAAAISMMMIRETLRLFAVGASLGLIGAASMARLLQYLLHGVQPLDPVLFAAVVALLGLVAIVASYAPARRAAAVDPRSTLAAD